MADPTFIRIMEQVRERLQGISTDNGYKTDIGSVPQLVGVDVIDITQMPEGAIVVEPGTVTFETEGGVRASTSPMEVRPSREVIITAAVSLEDKTKWLVKSEELAGDIRMAMAVDQNDWRAVSVTSITQASQDAGWPESGTAALLVRMTFNITYIERG